MTVDFAPVKACKNIDNTHGEVCVKCNECGRFKKTRMKISRKHGKQKRFCPSCMKETIQIVKLYNPDYPEDGEVWQCTECKEHTSWAE